MKLTKDKAGIIMGYIGALILSVSMWGGWLTQREDQWIIIIFLFVLLVGMSAVAIHYRNKYEEVRYTP